MLSKNVIKDIQSLGLKKHREETGLFVAEGPKVVAELLAVAPDKIRQVFALADWAGNQPGVQTITEAELEKISSLKTPNQVVAVMEQWESEEPDATGFMLYLDAVQDPGNFGTILRIADWFGVKDVVCSVGCADVYNPKVVQATMASIARVNVWYDRSDQWLQKQSAPVYAATLHGEDLSSFPIVDVGILMIGNESKGIRPDLLALATKPVTIPRKGGAESLNAAVATGIILSHLLK